jgi:hypothetical protein
LAKGEALVVLLLVAVSLALGALTLQYFSFGEWQNLAGIAGVFFFAFFAIVIGAITKMLVPSIIGSAALTALVMVYVYPVFAIFMGVVFIIALGLEALDVYSESRTSYGY